MAKRNKGYEKFYAILIGRVIKGHTGCIRLLLAMTDIGLPLTIGTEEAVVFGLTPTFVWRGLSW